jgi:hypothetical protein
LSINEYKTVEEAKIEATFLATLLGTVKGGPVQVFIKNNKNRYYVNIVVAEGSVTTE